MNEKINEVLEEMKLEMEESLESLKRQYKTVRTGKVSLSVVDNVFVNYYGSRTKLAQVATVLALDASTIAITPWEKNLLGEIEKGIQIANIGVNPTNDGTQVKLFFPPMTTDKRKENVKICSGITEDAKVSIRNHRKDANIIIKKLEKDKIITADESKSAQDSVQKITDQYTQKADENFKAKEIEIMKV